MPLIRTCFAVSINNEDRCTCVSVIHINMEIMPGLRKIIGSSCVVLLAIAMMMVRVRGSVSEDVSKIIALVNNAQKAFNDGDLDGFVNQYTEDCRYMGTGFPELRGRAGQPYRVYVLNYPVCVCLSVITYSYVNIAIVIGLLFGDFIFIIRLHFDFCYPNCSSLT